jgi:hypothetical protein
MRMFVQIIEDGFSGHWYDKKRSAIGRVFEVCDPGDQFFSAYYLATSPHNDQQFSEMRGRKYTNGGTGYGQSYVSCWIERGHAVPVEKGETSNKAAARMLDKEW